jgi:hypothetical protein
MSLSLSLSRTNPVYDFLSWDTDAPELLHVAPGMANFDSAGDTVVSL